jgi:hypothetical protein
MVLDKGGRMVYLLFFTLLFPSIELTRPTRSFHQNPVVPIIPTRPDRSHRGL